MRIQVPAKIILKISVSFFEDTDIFVSLCSVKTFTMKTLFCLFALSALFFCSCDSFRSIEAPIDSVDMSLGEVADLLSQLPLELEQLDEVYSAVNMSSENGYDEEYMMRHLFDTPGYGVGGNGSSSKSVSYKEPMKDLIEKCLKQKYQSKSAEENTLAVESYIQALSESDIQIYWPFSETWDKRSLPVITFDPGTESTANVGYELNRNMDGEIEVRLVVVDEEMARKRPVWVVNRNDDSEYESLVLKRKQDPNWGQGGSLGGKTVEGNKDFRTLLLKEIKLNRNFDSWFAGASEIFVKCGGVEDFRASTEAEMQIYSPYVTDFMISVKRNQVGYYLDFNAVLISEWTDQLENIAFMVIEDDGGSRTSWDVEAMVRVKSKSYGIDISLPYNERDDIIWRGSLSRNYMEKYSGEVNHFGDIDLVFQLK